MESFCEKRVVYLAAICKKFLFIFFLSLNREKLSLHLSKQLMQVINCRGKHSMCRVNYLSLSRLQNLHFVYICPQWNRWCRCHRQHRWYWELQQVIGIAQVKAFSCAKNQKLWHMQRKHYTKITGSSTTSEVLENTIARLVKPTFNDL